MEQNFIPIAEAAAPPPGTSAERRTEPRHEELVERAVITFRGGDLAVTVLNISSRGTMLQTDIAPRIGESVVVRFEACSPIQAFVRWARDGRVGLNFGCEMILG